MEHNIRALYNMFLRDRCQLVTFNEQPAVYDPLSPYFPIQYLSNGFIGIVHTTLVAYGVFDHIINI